jgi:MerR family transcriptional regulator/heat shock protein HspR
MAGSGGAAAGEYDGGPGTSAADGGSAGGPGTLGVYAISVAAELVGTGQQNLRLYERKGLLTPERTDGGTRRYSERNLTTLRRIGVLLDEGLNEDNQGLVDDNRELRANNRGLRKDLKRARDGGGPVQ